MAKTVFIDFDGTFADAGVVPARHIQAVQAARSRGHRVLMCTGRPKSLLDQEDLAPFDGLVGAAGGYVEVDGEVLSDRRFPAALGAQVVALLERYDAAYIGESPDRVYGPPGVLERLEALLLRVGERSGGPSKLAGDILNSVRISEQPADESFCKITVFDCSVPLYRIAEQLAPSVGFVPSSISALGDGAGELFLADVNKSVGIEVVAARFGLDRSQIVAIGDSHNDIEMLQYADTGVAVAGSPSEVLAVADMVIPGPAENGIVEGFARLGLTA